MKEVVYQNNEIDSIVLKSQILDYVLSIENDYDETKIIAKKEIDHVKVSENLIELSEIEDENNNQCLSAYCKFSSEQLLTTKINRKKESFLKILSQ